MKRISIKYFVLAAIVLAVSVVGYTKMVGAEAPATTPVTGCAWSSNIGWICFSKSFAPAVTASPSSSPTPTAPPSSWIQIGDSGNSSVSLVPSTASWLNLDADGNLVGFGWSPNIGWVKFGGLSGFPHGGAFGENTRVNRESGVVTGWARACGGTISPFDCLTGRLDGWDGWIELAGPLHPYDKTGKGGVSLLKDSGKFVGYAWGSDIVGWLDFSKVTLGTPDPRPRTDFTVTLQAKGGVIGSLAGSTKNMTAGAIDSLGHLALGEDCVSDPTGYTKSLGITAKTSTKCSLRLKFDVVLPAGENSDNYMCTLWVQKDRNAAVDLDGPENFDTKHNEINLSQAADNGKVAYAYSCHDMRSNDYPGGPTSKWAYVDVTVGKQSGADDFSIGNASIDIGPNSNYGSASVDVIADSQIDVSGIGVDSVNQTKPLVSDPSIKNNTTINPTYCKADSLSTLYGGKYVCGTVGINIGVTLPDGYPRSEASIFHMIVTGTGPNGAPKPKGDVTVNVSVGKIDLRVHSLSNQTHEQGSTDQIIISNGQTPYVSWDSPLGNGYICSKNTSEGTLSKWSGNTNETSHKTPLFSLGSLSTGTYKLSISCTKGTDDPVISNTATIQVTSSSFRER